MTLTGVLLILFTTYSLFPFNVWADQQLASSEPKLASFSDQSIQKSWTISETVSNLISLGPRRDLDKNRYLNRTAKVLQIPNPFLPRGGTILKHKTEDFLDHTSIVILDPSISPPKPLFLIFETHDFIDGVGVHSMYFKISNIGKLERVLDIRGPMTPDNKAIPGHGWMTLYVPGGQDDSGVLLPKQGDIVADINDQEIQYHFRHEMDFWLKGMYRRKPSQP